MPDTQPTVLSVSDLNRFARQLIETHLNLLWVEGEISNFARPGSGHWYFSLKDDNAQVRCAMFRNANQRVRFEPEAGMQVMLRCRASLYEGRGEFQLIVEHMEEAGFGKLQREFEQLKAKLLAEGLFQEAHKRPLPQFPHTIGIVTSPSGAALHDMLHVLARRYPLAQVMLYPTQVQGAEAPAQIISAIELANHHAAADVLLVGRGGGSLEDLWAFNDEQVVRAIFASEIPVVSAVGHETDVTLADWVADVRAPTPSAAAEICSPDGDELRQQLAGTVHWLVRSSTEQVKRLRRQLQQLRQRLRHPRERLQQQAQRLDYAHLQLQRAMQAQLVQRQHRLEVLNRRLQFQSPQRRLQDAQQHLARAQQRLLQSPSDWLQPTKIRLQQQMALLAAVSPLQVLARGYAVVQKPNGEVIKSSRQVSPGERVTARLGDGTLALEVKPQKS